LAIILSRYLNEKKCKKILFLTYNKLISEQIKSEVYPNTEVMTFHRFLKTNAPNSINILNDSDTALNYIVNNCINKYDTLIIDESQSLNIRWLIQLKQYFTKDDKEVFFFSDTIQSLSHEEKKTDEYIMKELSISDKYVLTKNYRAPEKVYNRLNEFFEPSIEPSSIREITNKDLYEVFDEDPRERLTKAFHYLEENNVNMKNVALLMPSALGAFDSIKSLYQEKYPDLLVETINKFRGMEKPIVVILLTIENDFNELYVAYSRSTTQTIVILHKPLIFTMPDFASILLKSNTTQQSIKKLISNHINNLRQEYFIDVNRINHNPSTFKLYYQENFWIVTCDTKLTIESKILLMYLNISNEKVIVFENNKLEKVKLFHPLYSNEFDNLKSDNLKYSKCYECNKNTYNSIIDKKYFCIICSEKKKINKEIFKNKKYTTNESYILSLIPIFRNIKNRIENEELLVFLNDVNAKYNLIAYVELLKVLTDELKYNDIVELNYLRTHHSLNSNIYLKSKWNTYCQHLTSKLINYNILMKEGKGKYKLMV
ncbi:MAG: AAA family ATPase, partial [Bacteriovorax sp.]|nr:AAA family ATPase [Bacteriovorax sp.]